MTKEGALIEYIKDYLDSGCWRYEACYLTKEDLEIIVKALENVPKTGHWLHDGGKWVNGWACSECGYKLADKQTRCCPYCGRRMESEVNNETPG